MAAGSGIRIGDAEREATAQSLRENYAQGRLTMDEFQQRLDATFAAKTDTDLNKLTDDLPHSSPYDAPWPPGQPTGPMQSYSFSGGRQSGPRYGSRPFALAGAVISLLALVLVIGLFLPFGGLPKAVLILLAVFGFARRILRRFIGGSGSRRRRW